jgi:hypothetical protein
MTNAKPLLIPLPHSIPSLDITSPTSPIANGQSCFTRVPLDKDSLSTSSSHGFRTLSPVTAAKTLAFSHLSKPSHQPAHPSLGHDCSISSTESQSKTSFDQSVYETSELEPDVSNPELESFSNQPPQPEAAGDEGVPAKIQQGKHKQSFFDFSRFKGSVNNHEK